MSEEQTVSLVDVLEEDEELEEEASAVLAGSDSDHCSYPQVSLTWKIRFRPGPADAASVAGLCEAAGAVRLQHLHAAGR